MNIKNVLPTLLILVFIVVSTGFVVTYPPHESMQEDSLSVVLGGDIFVGNRLKSALDTKGAKHYTNSVNTVTTDADLHLANLESPITTIDTPLMQKRYLLKGSPQVVMSILKKLSVDGLSLANNHILDFGNRGILQTVRYLSRENIKYTGISTSHQKAGNAVYFKRSGMKIGFLAFSNTFPREYWIDNRTIGTDYGDYDRVREAVKEAQKKADVIIVSFHWGSEHTLQPKSYQTHLSHLSIDAGADVVFGHHPHSIQPVERYNDGLIFYSLGNYFFTTLSHDVKYGLLAEVKFKKDTISTVKFHVMNINNYQVEYAPQIMESFESPRRLAQYIGHPGFLRVAKDQKNTFPYSVFSNRDPDQ